MDTKLIVAIIRRAKLEAVEEKLKQIGVERVDVSGVKGYGEYHNYYTRDWLEYETRIEIFTRQHKVERIVGTIMEAAHTGLPGDGVIAVVPIDKLFVIRTKVEASPQSFWPKPEP